MGVEVRGGIEVTTSTNEGLVTLAEAVDMVIKTACEMPMDSFRDAPERWRDKFGALQAAIYLLASARHRKAA